MAQNNTRQWLRPLIIGLACSIVISLLTVNGLMQRLEGLTYDWRMSLVREGTKIDEQVAVILIDDNSLKTLDSVAGRWPWPRSIYAELLDFIALGEPKAVLFDITFHEKQRTARGENQTIDDHDFRLVEATSNYPFVYHAARFLRDTDDEGNKSILNRPLPELATDRFSLLGRMGAWSNNPHVDNLRAPANNVYYLPFDELLGVSPALGAVDVNSDSDGVYRRARLFHRYQDAFFPSLSTTALLDRYKPQRLSRLGSSIKFGDISVPVDQDEEFLVNYYQHYDTYSFGGIIASLQQIQRGELEKLLINPDVFKSKYVFVGASAAGLEDLKNTPIDSRLPGVFIHAAIASNILNQEFLAPTDPLLTYLFIVLLAFVTAFGVLYSKTPWQQNGIPLLVLSSFAGWAVFEFFQFTVVAMVAPLLAGAASWSSSFSLLVFTEGKEKRKFKRMMSQYLSPAVLETVLQNRDEFGKAEIGSRENITILFSDIRGFTSLSEQLSAEKVVEILNHYFSKMTEAIFDHRGTIDKFIGDAIMAFWGAPIKNEQHADESVQAALEMVTRLATVNEWLKAQAYPPIDIGIGLHTGDVIIGNIGSEHKLDYTVIGDNVNLASRMEGLTKTYGTKILITESTFQSLKKPIPCRAVDFVKVKGKNRPIKIYQPIDASYVAIPANMTPQRLAELSEQAFDLYLKRQWFAAIDLFKTMPDDLISQTMIERCKYFAEHRPDADWDGSYTMKTK